MAQRTLWSAIDSDRRRWIRASLLVSVLLAGLALAVWFAVVMRSGRAFQFVFRILVPLMAVISFPLLRTLRETRAKQALGAVPLATGMAPDTTRAVHDIFLAAGLPKRPVISMWVSENPNAFVTEQKGKLHIAVSTAFTKLSRDEQRAGIAMLVGRSQADIAAFAAEHQLAESAREDPIPPSEDPTLFSAWLDAAVAGDREGLKILAEPVPMICLLERLSITSTVVPELAFSGASDASFGFLAWPYVDAAKPLSADALSSGMLPEGADGLPPEAAVAVAAVIAEEKSFDASSLSGRGRLAIGGAEAIRAQRLREVSGAEGAIAGSTSAAARRRRRAAETPAAASESPVAGEAAPAAVAPTAAAAAAAATAAAPTAAVPLPTRPTARIAVHCDACGASNAPTNDSCIACGAPLVVA